MPIKTETISISPGYDNILHNSMNNMAKSISGAIGSEVIKITDSSDSSKMSFCVPMAPAGYTGWCIVFDSYMIDSTYYADARISLFDEANRMPNQNDEKVINYLYSGSESILNTSEGYPETCVMIYDANKDTVLLDVHHGSTMHATDLDYSNARDWNIKYTFCFMKDTNGEIVCGIGDNVISCLRNKSSILSSASSLSKTLQKFEGFKNILQLTKMVNYFSPSCLEMKSAYVSVIRPFDDVSSKKRVSLYNLNGIKYGTVGDTDIWLTVSASHSPNYGIYFPIHPFVKY